jgi:ElaB/YqjD/DUF883 family membrane-anchored ribosome-binding protein
MFTGSKINLVELNCIFSSFWVYPSIRKEAFDQIQTIDSDIKHWISRIRKNIAESGAEINKEMERQRLKTQKKIEEMRKLFSKRRQKNCDNLSYL